PCNLEENLAASHSSFLPTEGGARLVMSDSCSQRPLSDIQIGNIRRLASDAVNPLADHKEWAKAFHQLGRALYGSGVSQSIRESCSEVELWTDRDRIEDLARAVLRWSVDKVEADDASRRAKMARSPEQGDELRRHGAVLL